MTKHNKIVINTLKNYLIMDEKPHYAILLNGEWGSGKTFQVKNVLIEDLKKESFEYELIYISLFGIKTISELKEKISHEAFFGSDKKIVSRIKNISENENLRTINTLFGDVAEKFIGLNYNDYSKIFLKDWLGKERDNLRKILILDDLERLDENLKASSILAFLSNYLENTDLRVIIIGCETLIKNYEDYQEYKEKVIGETFKIETESEIAIKKFIDDLKIPEPEIFKDVLGEVIQILKISNLRIVRQTLIKAKQIYIIVKNSQIYKEYPHAQIKISGREVNKENYLKEVLEFFFIVNLQKLSGDLLEENITKAKISYENGQNVSEYIESRKKKNEKNSGTDNSSHKEGLWDQDIYRGFIPLITDNNYKFWCNFIWDGKIDEEKIKNLINADLNALTIKANINEYEDDVLLIFQMGYWNLSDEEFKKRKAELLKALTNGEYTDVIALIAAYAMLKHLSGEKIGLLEEPLDLDLFFDEVLENIGSNIAGNITELNSFNLEFTGYKGYMIYTDNNEEKIYEFVNKVKVKYNLENEKKYKRQLEEMTEKVLNGKLDEHEYLGEFFSINIDDMSKIYANYPSIEWLGTDKIWKVLINSNIENQRYFIRGLKHRYYYNISGLEERMLVFKNELPIIEELKKRYTIKISDSLDFKDHRIAIYIKIDELLEEVIEVLRSKIELGEKKLRLEK